MKKEELKTHWVADIFPLNQADVDAIADDIKENGQKLPILALADGRIVDGRNRWLACEQIGVEPIIETVEDRDDDAILALAVSMNGKRRQLTAGQKACAAAIAYNKICPPETEDGKAAYTGEAKRKLGMIHTQFGAGVTATKNALALLRNDQPRFERVKQGEAMDPVYKEWQDVDADRKAEKAALTLIAKYPDIESDFQANKIDRHEAKSRAERKQSEERELDAELRASHIKFTNNLRDVCELGLAIKGTDFSEWFVPDEVLPLTNGKKMTPAAIKSAAKTITELAENLCKPTTK